MAEDSKIEWTDHTFNPWVGCTKISPGCDHCYAEGWAKRAGSVTWGAERQRTSIANWKNPLRWQKRADEFMALHGRRQRVFCASLADVFDNQVPSEWRADLWRLIEAAPDLDWLLLTKRISNVGNMLPVPFDFAKKFPNVWIGATITSRNEMLRDAPKLKDVDARVRFWSVEPMLGNFGRIQRELLPEWVIVGGESGHHARPMNPEWAQSLRDQCAAAGVPYLFKQWGEWAPGDDIDANGQCRHHYWEQDREDGGAPRHEWPVSEGPDFPCMRQEVYRVGKKAAGRLLDGIEHNGFPQAV